ncbi:MAG: hypothetical protein R2796_09515 [Chitinophagaceae bacterium]
MLNPYARLTPKILQAMLRQPMFFVRQTYCRGAIIPAQRNASSFLLTHYAQHDVDKERAERHLRLLHKDPYRYLYNSTVATQLAKLQKAAAAPPGYQVYINLLPRQWKAGDKLKKLIHQYMQEHLPGWHFSAADKLQVTLKERYGELFIALLWKGRQTEVHLDEIEKFNPCVTT